MGHLRENGFEVKTEDVADMAPVKARFGVQPQHEGCHTAVVDGYVIEGHVPATDIARLLEERPEVRGLAVPGMPRGSPGMEGPVSDSYDVLTFDAAGGEAVYASYCAAAGSASVQGRGGLRMGRAPAFIGQSPRLPGCRLNEAGGR